MMRERTCDEDWVRTATVIQGWWEGQGEGCEGRDSKNLRACSVGVFSEELMGF